MSQPFVLAVPPPVFVVFRKQSPGVDLGPSQGLCNPLKHKVNSRPRPFLLIPRKKEEGAMTDSMFNFVITHSIFLMNEPTKILVGFYRVWFHSTLEVFHPKVPMPCYLTFEPKAPLVVVPFSGHTTFLKPSFQDPEESFCLLHSTQLFSLAFHPF